MKKLVFLAMMFGMFLILAGNVSAQKKCSKDGGKPMNISWKNNTKMTLRINWVNSKCEEEKNDRELKPGEVYDGSSYVGHWFMIRDFKTNKELGYREVQAQYATMGIPK